MNFLNCRSGFGLRYCKDAKQGLGVPRVSRKSGSLTNKSRRGILPVYPVVRNSFKLTHLLS